MPVIDEVEEADSAELDIQAVYQRKLMGLRRLPKRERAAARQAAKVEKDLAMTALRQRRARDRQARQASRRMRLCAPG